MNTSSIIIGLLFGLLVGAGGGYYFGYDIGYEKAVNDVNATEDASNAAVSAIGEVETNPYENVKLNPFE